MDTRYSAILFIVIVLAAAVGVAAAQTQSKNAVAPTPTVAPTAMIPASYQYAVEIVTRPTQQGSLGNCALGQQTTSSVYCPYKLTVPVGTTVLWGNLDTLPHTVVADDGSFQSGVMSPTFGSLSNVGRAQEYIHKFTKRGTYGYSDYLYPSMHGVIVVTG